MTTLKRVNVGSAFKVGLILNMLIAAILGIFMVCSQFFIMTTITEAIVTDPSFNNSGSTLTSQDFSNIMGAVGIAGLCVMYGVIVVSAGLFGGIYFALAAALYNLTSKWVGGLEVEFITMNPSDSFDFGKPKRHPSDELL